MTAPAVCCRVPYGLSSVPAALQETMTTSLSGLEGVQCYLDDVIIHGPSESGLNTTLWAVLHRINDAGLKLNTDKYHFWKTTLSFLGYRLRGFTLRTLTSLLSFGLFPLLMLLQYVLCRDSIHGIASLSPTVQNLWSPQRVYETPST